MQLAIVKAEPFCQFSCIVVFLWMWCFLWYIPCIMSRLWHLPFAKETKVPITSVIPRGFCVWRTSSLYSVTVSTIPENCARRLSKRMISYLSATAITDVEEAIALTIDATKVGEVYCKLAKYVLSVNPTLQKIAAVIFASLGRRGLTVGCLS